MKKTQLILILLLPLLLVITSCEKTDETHVERKESITWDVKIQDGLSAKTVILQEILSDFQGECKGIRDYTESVEAITATISKNDVPYSYRQEKYGWMNEIEIQIEVKENTHLPWPRLNGHTLYYFIGGGENPGIDILKDESAIFFGISENEIEKGKDTFISVPAFAKVDLLFTEDIK